MKNFWKKISFCSILFFALAAVSIFSTAEAKKMQSEKEARAAALKKVPAATVVEIDTDYENGAVVYEVELLKGGKEYKLEYRSSHGKLMKYEWEVKVPSNKDMTGKVKANALKKAEADALKKVKGAKISSSSKKLDDGMTQCKIRLKKGDKKYTLVYSASTLRLLEYEWEVVVSHQAENKYIGSEKAKSIALNKVPKATVIKVEFETDDGVAVYEVSMVKGQYEYDVKIDAKTGKILEFEKDIDD